MRLLVSTMELNTDSVWVNIMFTPSAMAFESWTEARIDYSIMNKAAATFGEMMEGLVRGTSMEIFYGETV